MSTNGNRPEQGAAHSVGPNHCAAEATFTHVSKQEPINSPIDPDEAVYLLCLTTVCGGETTCIDRAELEQYNADPDGYAARHFGFANADDYREWIECHGAALCGERTKAGKLCRQLISRIQLSPAEWREQHRSQPCTAHAKAMEVRS
jgi:hypothetical protein